MEQVLGAHTAWNGQLSATVSSRALCYFSSVGISCYSLPRDCRAGVIAKMLNYSDEPGFPFLSIRSTLDAAEET